MSVSRDGMSRERRLAEMFMEGLERGLTDDRVKVVMRRLAEELTEKFNDNKTVQGGSNMEKWRYLEAFEKEIRKVFDEMIPFLKSKQALYGPRSIGDLGERGIFCRVWDKVHRLKSILWDAQQAPFEETRIDTWRDLLGYSLYGFMKATGRWPEDKPSEEVQFDEARLDEAAKAMFVGAYTRVWGWDREYAESWWRSRDECERKEWREAAKATLEAFEKPKERGE